MSSKSPPGGEQWASRIGVILAVAGSAVGLGNFLRFPGNAAQNGGGAFMVPYFISLLVLGIPLCWAEWTMGRYGGLRGFNSAPGIFSVLWRHRAAKYFGSVALIIPLVIYMYYVVIESWCLGYAIQYLTGELMLGNQPDVYIQHFDNYVGKQADGSWLTPEYRRNLLILFGTFTVNFVLIYRGVSKGIELFCRVAMPMMAALAVVVLIRVFTLGTPDPAKPDQSLINGLGFMWNPKFDRLGDPKTWLAASGQIFFSLSVGFGVIINYASYLKRKDDVVLSGLTACSMNEFFEVCFGGLITIPAAFMFMGALDSDFLDSSFSLGFKALPNVFASMWGGRVFGFLWFIMLFIAAITSSISMLQPVIAFLEEGFGLKRHASAAFLGLISAIGCGYVVYFSKGMVALDTFDFWVGSVLIFVLALIQSVIYGWMFGIERGEAEAHIGANMRIPHFVQLMLKYVVPTYLIVILVMFCWNNVMSHDKLAATFSAQDVGQLENGSPSSALMQLLSKAEIDLPESAVIQQEEGQSGWTIVSDNGAKLLQLRSSNESISVYSHQVGYLESIAHNQAAFTSVLFISVIIIFLLGLVHIAGKRWESQGRLKYD